MKGIQSSIRSRESDGYGSKGSKLVSLIIKNEAISITLIRISLLKGIWKLFETRYLKMWKVFSLKEDKSVLYSPSLVKAWNDPLDESGMSLRSFCLINHKMTNIVCT